MTTMTILIRKTAMSGAAALFAPAVRPGAEVHFSSSVDGYEVVFPDNLPFDSPGSLSSKPTVRTIPMTAMRGVYVFHVVSKASTDPVAYLQLTVESGGIDKVGFSVARDFEIHTQLWVPKGPLTCAFKKQVVNEEASLSVWHGSERVSSTTIPAGSLGRRARPSLMLEDTLSIRLDPSTPPPRFGWESGGTRVIDIIVDPPG